MLWYTRNQVRPLRDSNLQVRHKLYCLSCVVSARYFFVAEVELEQRVKGKSTEGDSLSGVSLQKVFVATTQYRGRLLTYSVVYLVV
jgi:hypothetical protein